MLLVALACTTPEPTDVSEPPASESPADTDVPTVPDTDEPPASEVPLIGEALAGRCPNPIAGEMFLSDGSSMHRVTIDGVGRCNDGSPPVLYVGLATDPEHANDWVWLFDGGSLCTNHEGCAARWCGEDPPYGARDMSSNYTPAVRGGEGITSHEEWNAWRGWNHVFAVYCSSDLWIGAGGEHVFEGDPAYRLYFEGAIIAAEGVAAGVAGLVSDDGLVSMPSLAGATTVIVGGISAGSLGAAFHRDEIAAAAPAAELVTIFDSMFSAAPEVMDPKLEGLFHADHEKLWTEAADPAWGAVLMDACVAAHPNDVWECMSIEPLLRERFLEGPMLWIHDLRDPVIYKFYDFWGVSEAAYQQLGVDTLRLYEDGYPDLSLHAYSCGAHTTIDSANTFSSYSVVDAEAGGPAVTIHDALEARMAGERVIAIDSVPASTSSCF